MTDKLNLNTLRAAAEAQLSHATATDPKVRSTEELLHELQVREIELEMQNDELRRAHVMLEESRNRCNHYIDLYDFIPVGYLTLTCEGLITEINLAAAGLLGVDRCELLNRRFTAFVTPQDGDLWHLFFVGVLKHSNRQNIELTLKRNDGAEFPVQLNGKSVITEDQCSMLHITLTDITEIKKAEVALCEAEAKAQISAECMRMEKVQEEALSRLQKIASQLPGVVFKFRLRADGSSCFPYASEGIRDIYRLSPEEVREDASKVFALLHPDDYDGIITSIQKSERDLSPWCYEYRVRFDDGTVRWLLGNALLQREVDGSTLWYGFITDITERKKTEEALRKSRYQLESFIKQAPLSIAMFDLNMNYLAISDRWLIEFGRDYKDLIGRNHYEVHPDLPAEWKVIHQQGLAGAYLNNDNDLWIQKDGSEYWLSWTVSPWFDEKGSIGGIIMSSENITERKQAEQQLRIAAVAFESQDGIIITDANATILKVNRSFTNITGYSAEEVIGQNPRILSSGQHDKAFYAAMWDRINTTDAWEGEIVNKHKNGEAYIELLTIATVKNEQGQITNYVASMNDITERKKAKENAKEHLEKLAHVTRLGLMGGMASGIAHEVNQPLAAISTYTEVSINLINTENPDLVKLNEILFKTREQALRVGRIIHHMKEFGKSNSQQHLAVDINTLIYNATDLCIAEFKHNNVKLNFELTKNLPPVVVDHIQIEQVIINLIRNSVDALRALPPNQHRQLTILSDLTSNNEIQVSVKDNGLGIDKDQQHKILMPFHSTKINGTGMGLSISRSLIEANGGTLRFNSKTGKGTTFYFTLPIKKEKT